MDTLQAPPAALLALQTLDESAFARHFGPVVELSPWVAQRAWVRGPFADADALYAAMAGAIHSATPDEQRALLNRHPELAGREALAGEMTADSNSEQGRLGLLTLSGTTMARLTDLNRRYRERFGFPLVVALRLHATLDDVLTAAQARLDNRPAEELPLALDQVCAVMRGRLARALETLA